MPNRLKNNPKKPWFTVNTNNKSTSESRKMAEPTLSTSNMNPCQVHNR